MNWRSRRFWLGLLFVILLGVLIIIGRMVRIPCVRIITPFKYTTLEVGKEFVVNAVIHTEYQVAGVEIRLWDVQTNSDHKWQVSTPGASKLIVVNQALQVPTTLPPGSDYRLQIMALSEDDIGYAHGYSVWVKVAQ